VRGLAGALLILVIACGPSGGARPVSQPSKTTSPSPIGSPAATASPTPAASPRPTLFAVLEAPGLQGTRANTTVAIAGLDGYARAKTQFAPRSIPYTPDAATVLTPEAHVAAGVVYFIDGGGVVRTLDHSGTVRQVAVFTMTQSQQEISFAVSPDGKQLVAALLTSVGPTPSPGGAPWPSLIGPWKLELERAEIGGATTVLHRWQAAATPSHPDGFANIVMAGWDAHGPVAVFGSEVATQNALFNQQLYFGGHFANIDQGTGLPGSMLGSCVGSFGGPWSVAADGTRICAAKSSTGSTAVTVEAPGQPAWQPVLPTNPPQFEGCFVPSEDGGKLAMGGAVVGQAGTSTVGLKDWFQPEGWLDAETLIGIQPETANGVNENRMAYLQLSNPSQSSSLGFAGQFVGVIG
jgi:hypothetical protein